MSEHAPDRVWSGIDVPKTIAGVLAAVSAAVLGSFLGVAGTLVGAAVASVVGSVGTEIYRKFIDRGHKKIVSTFVTAPAAVGTPSVVAAAEESPSQPEPEEAPAVSAPRKMRWGRVSMVAAGIFVLAIATLTTFELVTGRSAADAVGHHTTSGTTIGSVFGGNNKTVTTPASTSTSTAPGETPTTGGKQGAATTTPATTATTGSTPSAAPTDTGTPAPVTTDTQNSNGGAAQNNEVPPATQQPQGTG
jgi:multisubunit Na+/H+ antiporter MnhF subunit